MEESYKIERQPNKALAYFNLVLKCGTSLGFPYSHICETEYKPTNQLIIRLHQNEIIIAGQELGIIHTALMQQRLIEVIEQKSNFTENGSQRTIVRSILIR